LLTSVHPRTTCIAVRRTLGGNDKNSFCNLRQSRRGVRDGYSPTEVAIGLSKKDKRVIDTADSKKVGGY